MDEPPPLNRFEADLRGELEPGERLLWHAAALPRAKKQSKAMFLFAIPWTAFALFWMGAAWTIGSGAGGGFDFFPLFGIPFVLIGLFMLTRPLLSRLAARRTAYAITDRRVIQLYKGKATMSEAVPLSLVGTTSRTEDSNGCGSLSLTLRREVGVPDSEVATRFDLGVVPDVRRAESVLKSACDRAKVSS